MSVYNIHAGHGLPGGTGCGAVSVLNESKEARLVAEKVITYLRNAKHTVYDTTQNINASAKKILSEIVQACNEHDVDYDVSIHLNAGRNDASGEGDGNTGGCEVYGYSDDVKAVGAAISANIAKSLGIRDRGFMINQNLYVLRNTKAKALLIECCFVDDVDDAEVWNVDKCARAIVEGLTGAAVVESAITSKPVATPKPTTTSKPVANTNALKYSIGTYVTVSSYYTASTHPVSAAKFGTKSGTIIKTYPGRNNPYAVGVGTTVHFFCNDGDIRSIGKGEPAKVETKTLPTVLCQVYAKGKWWSVIEGDNANPGVEKDSNDYAGVENAPATAVAMHLSNGAPLTYRVHTTAGKWLGWISKHDINDYYHGFAGDQKNAIDAIQVKCDSYTVEYKVSSTKTGKTYYPAVADDQKTEYAGVFGKPVDKVMCWVKK